ncbi:MAG: biopolymer transporter ExbD [Planctomycetes bacterium]|jgi:biopolymer transport protein ExbD|nr:biopolymer transporter ExbD [Planctomycetota bacterium]MCL4731451.1 biopolymer transporter ExbD [Planctomycetota bacterium]
MARKRRKRQEDSAKADLTPMIDVTFQLLIFFILCTRFKVEERNHRADLPLNEGLNTSPSVPKEQITIYCNWDPATQVNDYVVAIGARGRKPVDQSRAGLKDMVIFPNDGNAAIRDKKILYSQVFNNLVKAVEDYIVRSGAKIEKLEISFAKDATQGVKSGTAPWMFVSLAIDASARVNANRKAAGKEELTVTFKFADGLGKHGR